MTHEQHSDRDWLMVQVAYCRRRLAETMATGGDPLSEMSWAGLAEKWQDKLDCLPAMPTAGPAEAAEGGPAVQIHAGSGEARNAAHGAARRPSEAMRAGIRRYVVMDDATADAFRLAATMAVAAVYDQAVALATGEGPVPLVGREAWVEGNIAYAARVGSTYWVSREDLDDQGAKLGLPRARLVPVEG